MKFFLILIYTTILNVFFLSSSLYSNELNLVYVGPTQSDPSSLFGHIFLLDKDENFLYESTTYSYMALLPKEELSFFSYINNGLNGGFKGKLLTEKLYKLLRRYAQVEDRSVIFFKLNKNLINLQSVKEQLKNENQIPYKFFSYNCTSHIRNILSNSSNALINPSRNLDYPLGLVRELLSTNMIEVDDYWASSTTNFNFVYNSLKQHEKKSLRKCLESLQSNFSTNTSCDQLTANEKKALSAYYKFRLSYLEKFTYLIKVSKYSDNSIEQNETNISNGEVEKKILQQSGFFSFSTGYTTKDKMELNIRPSYRNSNDFTYEPFVFDEFNLLEMGFTNLNNSLTLKYFSPFRISSFKDYNLVNKRLSLSLGLNYTNKDIDPIAQNNLSLDFGLGLSKISENHKLTVMLKPIIHTEPTNSIDLYSTLLFEYEMPMSAKFNFSTDYIPYQTNDIAKMVLSGNLFITLSPQFFLNLRHQYKNRSQQTWNESYFGLTANF